ncbi:MAG TPA: hypothetical protein VHD69_00290 [Candidatus Paceibacterota bacterium]|nr:hypothetical protein [Candidatus Paceibacterota bacterium]
MKNRFIDYWNSHPKSKKIVGFVCVVIGIVSVLTPFTPFGFIGLLGLELLGLREKVWKKLKPRLKKS